MASHCTPSDVIWICCTRAGHPEARSVAPTSVAVRTGRAPPRVTAEASGALAFEAIAAYGAKERNAIDACSARRLGHVAARLLEKLRDVLALEAFEQLGLRHAK